MLFSKNNKTTDVTENKGGAMTPYSSQGKSGKNAGSARAVPSIISTDLDIVGNLSTTGDIQIEGTVEGDVQADSITIGQTATVRGELIANETIIHGRVIGRIRSHKVRLSSTSRVEGNIIHYTIAIEVGAEFHGLVERSDNPVGDILFDEMSSQNRDVPQVATLIQVSKS